MIELDQSEDIWTLTINRPDKANSLTSEMLADLIQVVKMADKADLRALILTGGGDKVFSAGADLEEAKAGLALSPLWEELSRAIVRLPCLTIAALNGTLAGGAFGMVLACDVRLAPAHAKFFYPVAKLGFLPQPSDPRRLATLVGPARAKMILVAGQKITADEALIWGLVDRLETNPLEAAHSLIPEAKADHMAAIKSMI
ncbi:enoyl-CoA hydratase/isomerase family protein [Thalassobacter stenotrophicus]|uniref:Enoyl-CoA hydratase/carnithine racemase n=2 Tax=Thalassobacter stenotrophicus TaxID=266809 RepID=A0ABY1IAW0_9RHOB|nr:enoyl-CoA hydratase/isomerase family protein [Thalassobacter stenotrophicus]PVZ49762.1 enoyl-CoA hydratase/isomerase family protein [Thalassobacter stenotrophicus]CUH59791.1 putative enoyl-CoA hydratase echA6 [Thalassobacter stenotrophicus]SHI89128.1 Enoyl-CoA hydratase/carnithine racemase [Thalassobacter stenotrophicus DSM 16310]